MTLPNMQTAIASRSVICFFPISISLLIRRSRCYDGTGDRLLGMYPHVLIDTFTKADQVPRCLLF